MKNTILIFATLFSHLVCSTPFTAAETIGWRGNGTGQYASADPPTVWSVEKNVLWKTKLPGKSHSGPVVVGQRVFTIAEPNVLLCLNALDGKVLWQKRITYKDVFNAEAVAEIEADLKTAEQIKQKSKEIRKQISELRKAGASKEKYKPLEKKSRKMLQQIDILRKRAKPKHTDSGNTAATPISDGKHIFAVFGNGFIAAYSLDGESKWFKYLEPAKAGSLHSTSPVIVDGKIIIHIKDLVALKASTGEQVWQTKVPKRPGSLIVATAGNSKFIVAPSGTIVKANDGTFIAKNLFRLGWTSPIIHENSIIAILDGKAISLEIPKSPDAKSQWKIRWQTSIIRQRRFASPVVHKGLLYGVTEKAILEVIDITSGKIVYRKRIDLGTRDKVFPSPTSAGDYIFISSANGTTLVLKPGKQYKQVARNQLEAFSAAPVFVGQRMYVRGKRYLYCIKK